MVMLTELEKSANKQKVYKTGHTMQKDRRQSSERKVIHTINMAMNNNPIPM